MEKRPYLDQMAETLLEKEVLEGEALRELERQVRSP